MSFPRYPSYKDSGVEWLGKVPAHWDVLPCRAIVHERTAKNEGAVCTDYLSLMANVGVIPYAEKGDVGNKKPEDVSKCKIVARGDFVINSMNYGIGSYGLSDYDGVCSSVYIVLKPQNVVVESRFAFRIFENRSFQTYAQSFGNGILEHRCAINWDILKPIGVGVPPMGEQQAILAFLDRETAKIDELVAEQRRLMELLKEKRQAVISRAVTQGLNPHAPMKPSSIEWLGDVPAHWEVVPLKHLCVLLKDGTHLPPERVDDGIPLLSVRNLVDGEFVLREDDSMISEESYQDLSRAFVPKAEDVLLAIVGATLGKTAVISGGLGPFHIQRSVAIFRTRPDVLNSGFLNLVFQSRSFQALLWELVGYSAQPGIYLGTLQNIRIPVPPLGEQTRILESISSAANELTGLTTEAQRAIDLLQERRTALISAAVTGQIDVRGFVASSTVSSEASCV